MSSLEKYNKIFQDLFSIEEKDLKGLEYQSIDSWDSVGHMGLIAEIEEVFDIDMEADDVIDFSSYEIGKEILGKYEIKL